MGVDHYENFPVASVLSPPQLRPAIVAIYHFARTADDLADEGSMPADERMALLERYRRDLHATYRGDARSGLWERIFVPLARARDRFALPLQPLDDLLSAFMQDTGNPRYPDRATLLDYCRRSANPVGRLLLHLYGVHDSRALQRADDICTALQLINFWQDLSVDVPRGRCYVPEADAREHGLDPALLTADRDSPAARALVRGLCDWAESLMLRGPPLARQLPGRGGWELRFVVAGGLRVVDKIRRLGYATALTRPTLGWADAPALVLRVLRLPPTPASEAAA